MPSFASKDSTDPFLLSKTPLPIPEALALLKRMVMPLLPMPQSAGLDTIT